MSQSLTMNQIKYWDYRARLKSEFVVIGTGQGKSIPAESTHSLKGEAHFADATVHLGWYISMLCTEYQLSLKGGYLRTGEGKELSKEQTLLELYYALLALNRLDEAAEPFFNRDSLPQLNGFFIRDDVTLGIEKALGLKKVNGDYTQEEPYNNEMSQDQAIHILMGLMFVKDFIPPHTQVKGIYLRQMAIDQAMRILNYMKSHHWHLVNPVIKKNKRKLKPVKRGSEAFIFSQGFHRLMREFSDEPKQKGNKVKLTNKLFWSTMRSRLNPTYFSNDNRHLSLALVASSNGFRKTTYRKLMKRSRPHEWYAYPLMNLLMYPENRRFRNKKRAMMAETQALLDRAPASGPRSTFPVRNENGWTSQNMFLKDYTYQREGRYFHEGKEFNGLDYLLMYNLFMMHRGGLFIQDEGS